MPVLCVGQPCIGMALLLYALENFDDAWKEEFEATANVLEELNAALIDQPDAFEKYPHLPIELEKTLKSLRTLLTHVP